MSHFDDKSEIIDIKLTSYGKHLLSKGKFKPVYYCFFDDEVLYDSKYINLTESQNEIQTRILNETPSLKTQINFTGVEDRIVNSQKTIIDNKYYDISNQQNSVEKNFSLSMPLGKSSYNSEYYPAWNLSINEGQVQALASILDNSSSNTDSLQPYFKLPQIQLSESIYKIVINKGSQYEETGYEFLTSPYIDDNNEEYYFSVKQDNILIDLAELNVDDLKENFDIEVYIEEEKQVSGKQEKINVWRQLMFPKQKVYIKNDILLDEPENSAVDKLNIDSTYAEHYIDILTDEQLTLTSKQLAKLNIYTPTPMLKTPFGEDC